MDLSKLDQNEKLAMYGSLALLIGGIVGYSYGLTALGILAAIAMLVVIFLPQFSPGTNLPGTRGSLMVAAGGLAGAAMLLALLSALAGALLINTNFRDIFFLIAVAGAALMAWAGWQELQAEGGKLQFGTTTASGTDAPPAAPAAASSEPPAADEPHEDAPYRPAPDPTPESRADADEPPSEERRTEL